MLLAMTVLVTAGLSLLPASVARAASLQVCTLQEDIVYQPPLTNTPQTVSFAEGGTMTPSSLQPAKRAATETWTSAWPLSCERESPQLLR
ncbi:hypothetical protein AB0J71_49300 [Nonomuraea sp. NPDC049637]|uniref:hypothetical protein n=1 Tax=Nonomuraea sp. NPDC049637 TaxID=3154356 RepID=UPI00343DFEAD